MPEPVILTAEEVAAELKETVKRNNSLQVVVGRRYLGVLVEDYEALRRRVANLEKAAHHRIVRIEELERAADELVTKINRLERQLAEAIGVRVPDESREI